MSVTTPTASPGAGTYSAAQSVILSSDTGAVIAYTVDGTTPAITIGSTVKTSIVSDFESIHSSWFVWNSVDATEVYAYNQDTGAVYYTEDTTNWTTLLILSGIICACNNLYNTVTVITASSIYMVRASGSQYVVTGIGSAISCAFGSNRVGYISYLCSSSSSTITKVVGASNTTTSISIPSSTGNGVTCGCCDSLGNLFVGIKNDYIYKSSNDGSSWIAVTSVGAAAWSCAIAVTSGVYFAAASAGSSIYTADSFGDTTWTAISGVTGAWCGVTSDSAGNVFFRDTAGSIYKITGTTATLYATTGLTVAPAVNQLAAGYQSGTVFVATVSSYLYKCVKIPTYTVTNGITYASAIQISTPLTLKALAAANGETSSVASFAYIVSLLSLYVNSGSTWVKASAVYVNNNGTWVKVTKIYDGRNGTSWRS